MCADVLSVCVCLCTSVFVRLSLSCERAEFAWFSLLQRAVWFRLRSDKLQLGGRNTNPLNQVQCRGLQQKSWTKFNFCCYATWRHAANYCAGQSNTCEHTLMNNCSAIQMISVIIFLSCKILSVSIINYYEMFCWFKAAIKHILHVLNDNMKTTLTMCKGTRLVMNQRVITSFCGFSRPYTAL